MSWKWETKPRIGKALSSQSYDLRESSGINSIVMVADTQAHTLIYEAKEGCGENRHPSCGDSIIYHAWYWPYLWWNGFHRHSMRRQGRVWCRYGAFIIWTWCTVCIRSDLERSFVLDRCSWKDLSRKPTQLFGKLFKTTLEILSDHSSGIYMCIRVRQYLSHPVQRTLSCVSKSYPQCVI